jgi:D-alanine-D-alanine ligase
MEDKTVLGVVFGGQSGEHEVSRVSAYNVLNVIDQNVYDITCIGITKQGKWMIYSGPWEKIKDGSWEWDEANLNADFSLFTDPVITNIDIFFPVLHGPMGEDGTVQGVFEMLGKPYVGCGVLASSVGMDKVVSKILFESAGIPVTPYVWFRRHRWETDADAIVAEIEEKLGYPAFVKPVNMGSSVGISKAHDREELVAGIETALHYDYKVLVEAFIDGREIECAVLEEQGVIQTAVPGEIIASKEFYDYEAKYSDDQDSRIVIPAELPEAVLDQVRDYAVKGFEVIDGSGLSRVDFFVTRADNSVIINEVNTLPGFTNISMYPKMWDNMGVGYRELVERLIRSAARKRDTAYTMM